MNIYGYQTILQELAAILDLKQSRVINRRNNYFKYYLTHSRLSNKSIYNRVVKLE